MNVIQLGPLLLNLELLIFMVSAVAGYIAIKLRLSKAEVEGNISDKFVTALILGFFTWKLSLLIFDPVSAIQYPLSLLYFSGGDRGLWLAIAISILWLWLRTRKDGTTIKMNLDVLITGLLTGSSIYHFLLLIIDNTNIVFHTLYIILAVGLLIFLFMSKRIVGNLLVLSQLGVWFSLGMMAILFTEEERVYAVLSFSIEQIIFFVLFIMTLFMGNALEKKSFN